MDHSIVAADHDMVHVAGGHSGESVGDAGIVDSHEVEYLRQVCFLVAPCNDPQATLDQPGPRIGIRIRVLL